MVVIPLLTKLHAMQAMEATGLNGLYGVVLDGEETGYSGLEPGPQQDPSLKD